MLNDFSPHKPMLGPRRCKGMAPNAIFPFLRPAGGRPLILQPGDTDAVKKKMFGESSLFPHTMVLTGGCAAGAVGVCERRVQANGE